MIEDIIKSEWQFFQEVKNVDGRAECQDDYETFYIMRKSQFLVFKEDVLESYYQDLLAYQKAKMNPIEIKYARMMETNDPKNYVLIKNQLETIDDETREIIDVIVNFEVVMREEFNHQYPNLASLSRTTYTVEDNEDDTSFETYLRAELMTYSPKTLYLYGQMIIDYLESGVNFVAKTMENIAMAYGYKDLVDANNKNIN